MKFREFKSKFIKRSFICSIIAILICWFMKLVGFDLFRLDLDNKFFNDMSNFITSKYWLEQIYYSITLYLQMLLLCCIVNRKAIKETWLYLLITLPILVGCRILTSKGMILSSVSMIAETIVSMLVISRFRYKKFLRSIFIIFLSIGYQYISLITKSVYVANHITNFVSSQILLIDYYIILYLHKEVVIMDGGTFFFFGPTAWLYAVAGFITGIFKGHPIKNAKSWYSKGLLKEDVRKAEKSSITFAKAK